MDAKIRNEKICILRKYCRVKKIRSLIIRTRQQISNTGLVCLTSYKSWRRGILGWGCCCVWVTVELVSSVYTTVYIMKAPLKKDDFSCAPL
jgi:hypothetical protein